VCHKQYTCDLFELLGQAADEIERLRHDNEILYKAVGEENRAKRMTHLYETAQEEIELLRERNTILFDALRALTNGKSIYLTESLGRTVTMDAQNSWTETATDEEVRGE
jgi:hypothetical protein